MCQKLHTPVTPKEVAEDKPKKVSAVNPIFQAITKLGDRATLAVLTKKLRESQKPR
jgi:hypothetical protein